MSLKSHFVLMAEYNQWMNSSVYEAASQLSSAEFAEDRGAFFDSIMGTLNHILVGDTLWLKRFASHPSRFKSLDSIQNFEMPKTLATILHAEFSRLRCARAEMDEAIKQFSLELSDGVLSSSISYRNTKGDMHTKNLGYLISHFFNHQAHHRGQVSTLLNQAGLDVGITDLLAVIPDE